MRKEKRTGIGSVNKSGPEASAGATVRVPQGPLGHIQRRWENKNHVQECHGLSLPPYHSPTSASSREFTQSGPDKSTAIRVVLFQRNTPLGWRPFDEQALRRSVLFTVEEPHIYFFHFTCLLNHSQPVQKYRRARHATAALNKTKAAAGLGTDTAARETPGSEPSEP